MPEHRRRAPPSYDLAPLASARPLRSVKHSLPSMPDYAALLVLNVLYGKNDKLLRSDSGVGHDTSTPAELDCLSLPSTSEPSYHVQALCLQHIMTDGAYHYPPRGGVPRAFSASAISLIVVAPAR